jgi:hypothetical protein
MVNSKKKAAIIDYWRTVELFSPQNIPKVAPLDFTEPVFHAGEGTPLPWDPAHPLRSRRTPPHTSRRFQVYCGVYRLEKVRGILEDKFGHDPESFDERTDGESCLFAFSVTDDGRPLFDTFVVSTCAWATGRTFDPGPASAGWLVGFDALANRLAAEFAERLAVLPDDDQGQELQEKGFNLGRHITYAHISRETEIAARALGVPDLSDTLEIRIKAGLVATKNKFSAVDQDFLNSFFVKDLGRVAAEIGKKNVGEGLRKFLTGDDELDLSKRVDVRQSIDTLFRQLSPGLFPPGRWPSKDHHPLVFSQQFAVNSMLQELGHGSGIFAINGPPGTGKTTLLRDLIAAVVVGRATRLAKLAHPEDAFAGERRWVTDRYTRVISIWKDEFKGFEVVIASNNNGAVENVTMEIPGEDAVDPTWLGYADYFPDVASRLIGQPAWALAAARLGSKANRNEFRNRFWYGVNDDIDYDGDGSSVAGFADLLRSVKAEPTDWGDAVGRFERALMEERRLRGEREKVYQISTELLILEREIQTLEATLRDLGAKKGLKSDKLLEAAEAERKFAGEAERAKNRRLEHRGFRPGLFEILLSLGKAFREWRAKDKTLAATIERAEEQLDEARALTASRQRDLDAVEREVRRVSSALELRRQAAAARREELGKAEEYLREFFPMTATWEKEEEGREFSSPWSDPVWGEARTKVFLEALRLHKAFIAANAERMRKSLHGAMDLLAGAVPDSVPLDGVRAAWTTLFFVVPVISTTFASFDRLFSHLGREALGWLLIDEAGQAVPQSAVGAIWRAKRTVVVGDPLQLEPIVTLPFTAQQALRRYHNVNETWLPGRTSVQQLADRVSRLGTRINFQDGHVWVGAPLRVHRRCERPMFDISNSVAYDGMMVFGTPPRPEAGLPPSAWIDVATDESEGHWVPAEGQAVYSLLAELIGKGVAPKDIFLISPFRAVVRRLWEIANRFEGVKSGTIHTVQGKEADVVILVLGGDPRKPGAKQWASARPNLVNVAASRARRRLYVVGNKGLWGQYPYFNTAAAFLSKHRGKEEL